MNQDLKDKSELKKRLLFLVPMHISWDSFVKPQFYNVGVKKDDGKSYNIPRTDLPLGPLSMSAYLKKFVNVEVKLVDFNAEVNALNNFPYTNFESLCRHFLEELKDFNPDFVGVDLPP